ncbi:type VII secretion integral membrane protein EccD [Streptomyces alboflavus]|uniref:type VII secretion integral membrane protein EccD n=1 Tax=Streptomyces alboflavus TaxID=67267 RepID=UPI0036A42529
MSRSQGRVALSRVTLVGERRRVDLVLPSQEPVGLLLPEVMRLLDDRVGARPELRYLVAADGSALAQDSTLESAGVADGAVLRLVRAEDAPSAPVVHDVTDEAADDLDVRAWRWGAGARRVVCGIAVGAWALVAAVLARGELDDSRVGAGLLGVSVVAAVCGALFGRARLRGLAATLIGTAGVLGVFGAWMLGRADGWSGGARLASVVGVVVVGLLLLGWFTPLGRGGLVGSGALAACAVMWEAVLGIQGGGHVDRVGAVLAVVSVVALGVLPRLALMASGLSGLDDRRSGGASVSRYDVGSALAATHRGLALATVALAVSAGAAGVLALREMSVWSVLLAGATALVLALRARAFPLIVEVVALLAAAAAVVARLVWVWLGESGGTGGPLTLLVVLALAPLLVLAVSPAEHVRVRLRRVGDALESLGVIALIPLMLGVFGVYGRLLDTFA